MFGLKSLFKKFIVDWNGFWFSGEVPPYYRLSVKAFALTYSFFYLERLLNLTSYFRAHGTHFFQPGKFYEYFAIVPIEIVYIVYAVSLAFTFSWIFFPPRLWSKIYVYAVHVFFQSLNPHTVYGADSYSSLILFYLVFIDFTDGNNLRSRLALQCFKFHFCFTYINSGLGKLTGLSWVLGDGIYWAIFTHAHTSWFEVFKTSPAILTFMSHGVILLEIFGPIFIWTRYANVFVILLMLLHTGVMVTMGLYGFALICCSALLVFIKKDPTLKPQWPTQEADIPGSD
jgi:hypothetical protein